MTQLLKTLPPGVKPTGPVEIDWNHPLARGLVSFSLLENTNPRDMVRDVNATDGSTVSVRHDGDGQHLHKSNWDDNGVDLAPNPVTGSQSRTFLLLHKKTEVISGTTSSHLLSSGLNSTGNRLTMRYVGTTDEMRLEVQGGGVDSGLSVTLGEIGVSGFRFDGTQLADFDMFVNGEFAALSGTTTINTSAIDFIISGEIGASGGEGAKDNIYSMAFWDRALSNAEMLSYYEDPYQFLQPAGAPNKLIITTPPTPTPAEGYVIPDPKWEAPAMLRAGVKPSGPVAIDWDNPITKGLEYVQLFRSGLVNLVNGVPDTLGGAVELHGEYAYFPGGEAADIITVNTPFDKMKTNGAGYSTVSIFAIVELETGADSLAALMGRGSSASEEWNLRRNVRWSWYNGTNIHADTFSLDTKHTISGSIGYGPGENDGKLWQNGVAGGYKSANNYTYTSSKDLTIGGADGSVSRDWTGKVWCVYGYSEPLSDAQHKDLYRDPYQFLIPA